MLSINLVEAPLDELWPGTRVAFPLHSATGTTSTATMLIQLEPSADVPTHRDSAEELLLVLAGDVEATVGGEVARATTGVIAVVPPMVPHGLRNVGDTVARVVGFFPSSTVIATYDEPFPDGSRIVALGAPVPLTAELEEASTLSE
jgi:quercetin dioxygenase-like cupin family protein